MATEEAAGEITEAMGPVYTSKKCYA